jgi:hypothetical protein
MSKAKEEAPMWKQVYRESYDRSYQRAQYNTMKFTVWILKALTRVIIAATNALKPLAKMLMRHKSEAALWRGRKKRGKR